MHPNRPVNTDAREASHAVPTSKSRAGGRERYIEKGEIMKSITLAAVISISFLATTGCTGRIVRLENDQGTRLNCEVSTLSAMMTGVLIRDAAIDKCVSEHEAAGFKVIHEE